MVTTPSSPVTQKPALLEISGTVTEEGNSMSSKSVKGLQTHNIKSLMK
jgi:hypothetical protein